MNGRLSRGIWWVILTALVALFVITKLQQYFTFANFGADSGIYTNIAWNTAHGRPFFSAIQGHSHLAEHFSPITAAFAPLMWVSPTVLWLYAAQGLAVGLTFPLLFILARRILAPDLRDSAWILALILALAVLYRPLNSAHLYDFHPSTLMMPVVAGALIALHDRRNGLLWAMVLLLFVGKESGLLAILGLGIYAATVLRRHRLALALWGFAAAGAVFVFALFMPAFQDEGWHHLSRLGIFGEGEAKAWYLLRLLGGLAFLPLLAWRPLLTALPLIALNLSVGYWPQVSLRFHYDDMAAVFLLVAAIHGINALTLRLVTPGTTRPVWRTALVVVVTLTFGLVQKGRIGIDNLLDDPPTAADRAALTALNPYIQARTLPIYAQSHLLPHLAARDQIRWLQDGPDILDAAAVTFLGHEGLVLISPVRRDDRFPIWRAALLADPRFEVVEDSPTLSVFRPVQAITRITN